MTISKRRAIVSFANERGNYLQAQQRLKDSLIGFTDADFIAIKGEDSINAPKHSKNPYAFKLYAIEQAIDRGYTSVLYLDTSAYAVSNIDAIFDIIERDGYFMEEAGHYAGTWTNDRALEYFEIDRDEAMKIPMYSAGFTGLDFSNDIAVKFFNLWGKSMVNGCFKGQWDNRGLTESVDIRCEGHRHDMSCASIIAYQLGMKYQSGGSYFQYASLEDKKNIDTVCFYVQGL